MVSMVGNTSGSVRRREFNATSNSAVLCAEKFKCMKGFFYSSREVNKIEAYIQQQYGDFPTVIHEIFSPDIHVDIALIPPSDEQPYYKLVTMGAGAFKMNVPREFGRRKLERAEYVIFLPKDWDIHSDKEEDYWPIRYLKVMARLPIECDTWLGFGHSLSADEEGKPVAENTKFNSFLLLHSIGKENQVVEPMRLGLFSRVNFYQLYPLYQEELDYKIEHSTAGLFEKIDDDELDFVVNIYRKNFCL